MQLNDFTGYILHCVINGLYILKCACGFKFVVSYSKTRVSMHFIPCMCITQYVYYVVSIFFLFLSIFIIQFIFRSKCMQMSLSKTASGRFSNHTTRHTTEQNYECIENEMLRDLIILISLHQQPFKQ